MRSASIARSVSWGFWWRRFFGYLCADLALIVLVAAIFTWSCAQTIPASALDGIVVERGGISILSPDSWSFTGSGMDASTWSYVVYGSNGTVYTFPLLPYLRLLAPFAIFTLFCQLLGLMDFFSDTRRVRRQLQPLNDLAVMADALGQAGVSDPMGAPDEDKMATLEQAIARASVDSPMVSTGDQDLRSIEVALNGLLRQMQEAKLQQMRFVSDASHELRTPIAVIQGYVNMLDRWGASDEEVLHESIEALKAESEHMQELVEQLLFLARGDSGRNTLHMEPVNLAEIAFEVWEESSMIDETHTYLCPLTAEDTENRNYVVTGDLAMIKQALRIVVQNAEKYSPEGSNITLRAAYDRDGASLVVQDEGIGMSEEDAAHVFERFYRAENARGEDTGGSGLGLSIAKWIVDAHGGTIEVLSREGVGSRFTIRLPK